MESKTFRLPFDSSKKAYGLVDIHVRLLKAGSSGPQPVPFKHFSLVTRPPRLLNFELSMQADKTVGLARTTLNEGFLRNSSFAETIKQPVEVVASLALANPNPNLPDLEFRQLLRVQIETSTSMGWSVDNNLLLRPGPGLEMIADGHNHFTLQVWISRYEPVLGTSVDVSEEYEFEYSLDNPELGKVLDMDKVADPKRPGGTLGKTRWRSVEALPSSKFPYLPAAPATKLRVKAWKRARAKANPPDDSLEIPLKLLEPTYTLKLISPLDPIPALDTAPVELVLGVELNGAPAADLRVQLGFDPNLSSGEGRLEPTSLVTDGQGQLRVRYTPPALFYRPKMRLTEDILVHSDPARQHPLGSIRLKLLPTIKLKLEFQKHRLLEKRNFGFEFQPVELVLPAGTLISAIKGNLTLAASRPGGEETVPLVAVGIALSVWNRKTGSYDASIRFSDGYRTSDDGQFGWGLPEIESAGQYNLERLGLQAEPYLLSAERQELPKIDLSELAEAAIQDYETTVNKYTPFALLNADTGERLKFYRADYLNQLAGSQTDDFDRILSSLKLLQAAASHTLLFNEMYVSQHARLKEDFSNLFQEILDLLVVVGQLGERLVGLSQTLSTTSHELITNPRLRQAIFGLLQTLRTGLVHASEAIAHYLPGAARVGALLVQILSDLDEIMAPGFDLSKFFGRLLSVAAHTLAVIASLLLRIAATVISLIDEASVALLHAFEHLLSHVAPATYNEVLEILRRKFPQTSRDWGGLGLAQIYQFLVQQGLKTTLDRWCQEVEQIVGEGLSITLGGNLLLKLINKLNWLDYLADSVLTRVHQKAATLNVPADSESKLQEFQLAITQLRDSLNEYMQTNIEIDSALQITDLAVMLLEVAGCLIALLFSLGTAVAVAPLLSRIDKCLGVIKTFLVRMPQISLTTAGSLMIAGLYSVLTLELVGTQ